MRLLASRDAPRLALTLGVLGLAALHHVAADKIDGRRGKRDVVKNFAFPDQPMLDEMKDAALVVSRPPGMYSVQLEGVAGTTGIGLVEIYEAP